MLSYADLLKRKLKKPEALAMWDLIVQNKESNTRSEYKGFWDINSILAHFRKCVSVPFFL